MHIFPACFNIGKWSRLIFQSTLNDPPPNLLRLPLPHLREDVNACLEHLSLHFVFNPVLVMLLNLKVNLLEHIIKNRVNEVVEFRFVPCDDADQMPSQPRILCHQQDHSSEERHESKFQSH